MAFNFPSNPALNDTYSFGDRTWTWNGSAWQLNSNASNSIDNVSIGSITPSTGAFTAVDISGNVTAGSVFSDNYFYANGDAFVSGSGSEYSDANVKTYLASFDGNIIPSANITYDLGSETNRWRDIYLADSTIYLGEANISAQGGVLTLPSTVSIGNATLDASSGNLALPSSVSIGNVTLDASSGNLALPANSSIGGAPVATPRVTSIDYGGDDTAANVAGGQTIGIVGSGFTAGATVYLDSQTISVVSFVNSNRLEFTAPAKSTGSYSLYVINADGGTGIYVPGIQYSGVPAWSSPSAGSLGSVYETKTVSNTFVANSDSTVSYSLYSGDLPPGTTLDSNTGILSGTANLTNGTTTTYNFTVRATDEENQDTDRSFSLTINVDEISWNSPTDGNVIQGYEFSSYSSTLDAISAAGDGITYSASGLPTNISISGNTLSGNFGSTGNTSSTLTATGNTTTRVGNIAVTFQSLEDVVTWSSPTDGGNVELTVNESSTTTLSANSAGGNDIVYTANTLPNGLSLSGATITGTPTVVANTSVALTATANVTARSSVITVNFAITLPLGDQYFKQASLVLTSDDNTFISDASDNAFTITPNGDTRPSVFSPYNGGWSNYFENAQLAIAANAALDLGTNDFTIEGWFSTTKAEDGSTPLNIAVYIGTVNGSSALGLGVSASAIRVRVSSNILNIGSLSLSTWTHIAFVRSSGVLYVYVNGSLAGSVNLTTNLSSTGGCIIARQTTTYSYYGSISNLRIVKGTAVYTEAFTPPTEPLTAISGTSLLTCQSNRYVDQSPNNLTLTRSGDVKVQSFGPFSTDYRQDPASYSVYFDGNDTISVPSDNDFAFGTGDFTVEGWFYQASDNTYPSALEIGNHINSTGILFIVKNSGQAKIYSGGFYGGATTSLNQWNHIAWVRSSGSLQIYVNGILGSTTPFTNNLTDAATIRIASDNAVNSSYTYTGYISNLRVIKGTAVYTSNFTLPTEPLTAVSGTSLLTCQSPTIVDNSSNAFTITANGNSQPSSVNPFDGRPASSSIYFDGVGDAIYNQTNEFGFGFSTGDYTIEGWFNTDDATTEAGIFNISGASGGFTSSLNFGASFLAVANGYMKFCPSNGTSYTCSGIPISTGIWYHFALVRNSGVASLYINGVKETSVGTNGDITSTTSTNSSNMGIGAWASVSSYPFGGYLSNIRVIKGHALYTSNFTPPTSQLENISGDGWSTVSLRCIGGEIKDYVSTAPLIALGDISTSSISTTNPFGYTSITNTVITNTTTGSGYFDGNDYLTMPTSTNFDVPADGDFTVEGWAYLNSKTAGYPAFFGNYSSFGAGSISLFAGHNSSSQTKYHLAFNGTFPRLTSTSDIIYGQWNHFAITRESTTIRMFINGVLEASVSDGRAVGNATDTLWLGVSGDATTGGINGYMSNFRWISGTALYTANFVPPTAPLTAVSGTQLLTLQNRTGYNNSQPIDESGLNNVITRSGNASTGSFSPHVPTGWSGYFDGSDYLGVTGFPTFGTGDFTVEWWGYKNDTYNDAYDITDGGTGAFAIYSNTAGTLFVTRQGVSGAAKNLGSLSSLNPNQWYYFAIIRESGNVRCYVDGQPLAAAVADTNSYGGATKLFGTADGYWPGYISNFRVFTSAIYDITSSSIPVPTEPFAPQTSSGVGASLLLLRSPTFNDESPSRLAITRYNDSKITPFSPFASHTVAPDSYSVYFDGTGDYLTTTWDTIGANEFTCEAWVYITEGSARKYIVGPGVDTATHFDGFGFEIFGQSLSMWASSNGTTWNMVTSDNSQGRSANPVPLNTWTHVVMTRDSSGVFRSFINGKLECVVSPGTAALADSSTTVLNIGRARYTGDFANYSGYMSNLRIVNGSVVSAYSTASTTVGDQIFTPSSSILTAISGTSLLTCQSPTVIDNSTNDFEITVNGNSQPTKFNPFGETVTSGVEYSPTSHGGSVYFDGNDYIQFPAGEAWNFGSGPFTMEMWIYPDLAEDNSYSLFSINQNGANQWSLSVSTYNSWGLYFYWGNYGSNQTERYTGVYPIKGQWNHVVVCRDASYTWRFFINGVLYPTSIFQQNTAWSDSRALNNTGINPRVGEGFTGYVTGIRVTKRVSLYTNSFVPQMSPSTPTPEDVLFVSAGTSAIQDKTGRNVLETAGNTRTLPESPFRTNKSVFFDGTGDYLSVSDSADGAFDFGTGDFSVECWVKGQNPADNDAFINLTSGTYDLLLRMNGTNGWQLYFQNGSYAPLENAPDFGTNATEWTHHAVCRVSGTLKWYINGIQAYTRSDTTDRPYTRLDIGYYVNYWDGYISNVRVLKGASAYTGGTNNGDVVFTPPTQPLTAISGTTFLGCQSYNFKDNSTSDLTITPNGEVKIISVGPFTETQTSDNAMYFDGSSGNLLSPLRDEFTFGTGDFTVEGWFYFNDIATNARALVGLGDGANGSGPIYTSWVLQYLGSDGSNQIRFYRYDGTSYSYATTGLTLSANVWTHIAVSRAAGTLKIFVNGQSYYSATVNQTFAAINTNPLRVGLQYYGPAAGYGGPRYFNGYMDDIRITKGVARYTSDFTPPTSTYTLK